jgi:hypothetical protein
VRQLRAHHHERQLGCVVHLRARVAWQGEQRRTWLRTRTRTVSGAGGDRLLHT